MDIDNKKYFFFSLKGNKKIKEITVTKNNCNRHISISILGSKSFTNRAIVLAGMSAKSTKIEGFLFSEDSYWGLNALKNLGFKVSLNYKEKFVVISPPEIDSNSFLQIFYGKAGTLARFFPAVILNWQKTFPKFNHINVIAKSEEQLSNRPLRDLVTSLRSLNAQISCDSLPMQISSSHLSGHCSISGKTSGQFLSGLLLAACAAKSKINIQRIDNLVQPDYIKMTLNSIMLFGGQISYDEELTSFHIMPSQMIGVDKYMVEADASTSCYFMALAYLHNFNLRINNLGSQTLQPDFNFISYLKILGANIEVSASEIFIFKNEIFNKPKGNHTFDFSQLSDQALTMGVIALFADGPIEIRNISHIRKHECDRISCFIKNLNSLGIKCEEFIDGFRVYPLEIELENLYGSWKTFFDHRFVMSGFILASFAKNISLENPSCVEKTAPLFFEQIQDLGFQINIKEE